MRATLVILAALLSSIVGRAEDFFDALYLCRPVWMLTTLGDDQYHQFTFEIYEKKFMLVSSEKGPVPDDIFGDHKNQATGDGWNVRGPFSYEKEGRAAIVLKEKEGKKVLTIRFLRSISRAMPSQFTEKASMSWPSILAEVTYEAVADGPFGALDKKRGVVMCYEYQIAEAPGKPEANQRPDATSAEAPPSKPSQGAAVPHP